jgi:hypothetical protein
MLPSEGTNWPRASDRPQRDVRAEAIKREDAVELVRGILEWTAWSQARLAAALREVAKVPCAHCAHRLVSKVPNTL